MNKICTILVSNYPNFRSRFFELRISCLIPSKFKPDPIYEDWKKWLRKELK